MEENDFRILMVIKWCPSDFNRRLQEITKYNIVYGASCFERRNMWKLLSTFNNSAQRLLISEGTPRELYPFSQQSLESYVTLYEEQQFFFYNFHCWLYFVSDVECVVPKCANVFESLSSNLLKYIRGYVKRIVHVSLLSEPETPVNYTPTNSKISDCWIHFCNRLERQFLLSQKFKNMLHKKHIVETNLFNKWKICHHYTAVWKHYF